MNQNRPLAKRKYGKKKDWCEEAYEAYSCVEEYERHQYDPIEKYLAQFKSFIPNAEGKGIVCIQAFKMLDRSRATDSEKQFILHGLKKNSKDNILFCQKICKTYPQPQQKQLLVHVQWKYVNSRQF